MVQCCIHTECKELMQFWWWDTVGFLLHLLLSFPLGNPAFSGKAAEKSDDMLFSAHRPRDMSSSTSSIKQLLYIYSGQERVAWWHVVSCTSCPTHVLQHVTLKTVLLLSVSRNWMNCGFLHILHKKWGLLARKPPSPDSGRFSFRHGQHKKLSQSLNKILSDSLTLNAFCKM